MSGRPVALRGFRGSRQPRAGLSTRPAVEAGGHRGPERLPERGGVEAAEPVARVRSAAQRAHEPSVARMAHPGEEIAIDDGRALQASEPALPEAVVVDPGEQGLRRQMAGEERVADAEAPQSVLKSGRLSGEQDAAAARAARQGDLSRSAEAARVLHPEPDLPVEEVERAIEVAPLLGEAVEGAGRDRAAPRVEGKLGIS